MVTASAAVQAGQPAEERNCADWTHNDLQHDLAMHLRAGGERWVWCNIVLGDGGRPDCFTFRPYGQSAQEMVAYEIKVSREDLRSDLTKGKWQRYRSFAQGITFAVPKGLCKKGDVPTGCGLIVRSDTGWRHVRKPVLQSAALEISDFIKLLSAPPEWQAQARATHGGWRERQIEKTANRAAGRRISQDLAKYLQAPEKARAAVEEAERTLANAKTRAERIESQAQSLMAELAESLGIEGRPKIWEIRARIGELKEEGLTGALTASLERVAAEASKGLALLNNGGGPNHG